SKPPSLSFPPKSRAASSKLHRVPALPRERLDDAKSLCSGFRRCCRGVALLAVFLRAADQRDHAAVGRAPEIFKWINFSIVAGVIVWVFGKLLPPVFRKKADAISSAIKNAASAKAAADAELREAEAKLANLEKEVAELRASLERESAAELQRLRAATE